MKERRDLAQQKYTAQCFEAQQFVDAQLRIDPDLDALIQKIQAEIEDLRDQESSPQTTKYDHTLHDRLEVAKAKLRHALERQETEDVIEIIPDTSKEKSVEPSRDTIATRREIEMRRLAEKALLRIKEGKELNTFRLHIAQTKLDEAQKRGAWSITLWLLKKEVEKYQKREDELTRLSNIAARKRNNEEPDQDSDLLAAK